MSKCIYCGNKRKFNREHVIPQFFGKFDTISPVINNLVCNKCNSEIFSKLESSFKEDTDEGIYCQMLNLENCSSVRVRNINAKIDFNLPFKDDIFQDIFPFLKYNLNKECMEIKLKRQVRVLKYYNGFQVFLVDALEEIYKNKDKSNNKLKKFNDICNRFKNVKNKNVRIFTEGDNIKGNDIETIIELLSKFGLNYKEGRRGFENSTHMEGKTIVGKGSFTIDKNLAKIICKIAFNYFAYCCIQENSKEILYTSNFSKILSFIKGDRNIKTKDVITSIDKDYILFDEKKKGKRLLAHFITFKSEDNKIVSEVTFFGRIIYTVSLGELPEKLKSANFGCGHLFHPFLKTIHNLSQEPPSNPTSEQLKTSFGLYKRV